MSPLPSSKKTGFPYFGPPEFIGGCKHRPKEQAAADTKNQNTGNAARRPLSGTPLGFPGVAASGSAAGELASCSFAICCDTVKDN